MTKKAYTLSIVILSFLTLNAVGASTLYYNGTVWTNMRSAPLKNAWLLVDQGRVSASGTRRPYPNAETRVDLQGQFLMPALTDSHAHVVELGRSFYEVDLKGTRSEAEAVDRVRAFIKANAISDNTPVSGSGWDQSDWPGKEFPKRNSLDEVSTTQAIILYRVDGHAAWANTYALKNSSLWKTQEDPKGGKTFRNKRGEPEGVVVDTAMNPLAVLQKASSDTDLEKYIITATEQSLKLGITSIQDAGASKREIETMRKLLTSGRLKFRFYEMLSGSDEETLAYYLPRGKELDSLDGMLSIGSVKLYADGAMGSRGAAFELPYNDDPANSGLLMMEQSEMVKQMRRIDQAGFQIAIHAIGSKANHIALNAMEEALGKSVASKRPRIEHAQVMNLKDIRRLKRLGVIASMQPIHCTSDMKWVVERIGQERARYSYAWNSILTRHGHLAFGSDAPVDNLNPWAGSFAALTRQTENLTPKGGFIPQERISLREALKAYTEGAAFAAFSEKSTGRLTNGYRADFILLKQNPLKLSPSQLARIQVQATYVAGTKVWDLKEEEKRKDSTSTVNKENELAPLPAAE